MAKKLAPESADEIAIGDHAECGFGVITDDDKPGTSRSAIVRAASLREAEPRMVMAGRVITSRT